MKLITYDQLKPIKGIPHSYRWLVKLIEAGKFPRPVLLEGSRRKAWLEQEIDDHIAGLVRKREAVINHGAYSEKSGIC